MTKLIMLEDTERLASPAAQFLDDPYPDKTPKSILTREYLVNETSLTSGVNHVLFPHTLWKSNTTITKYLSVFRYYRGRMKVRLQFVSNPMIFGMIGISALPYTDSQADYISLQQQSQADMLVVDVSEQTSVELDLPYVRPYTFFDRSGVAPDTFWRVVVRPLHIGSVTLGSPETVTVSVFVTFPDLECSGYVPNGQFQSITTSTMARTTDLALRFAKGYTGYVVGTAAKSVYDAGNKAIMSRAENAGEYVSAWFDNLWTPSGSSDPNTPVGDQTLQSAAAPSENAKLDLFGNICSPALSSTMGATRLGDGIATTAGAGPGIKDLHYIADICSIPTFHGQKLFTAPGDTFDIPAGPIQPFTHASYMSQMFRYYRGSSRLLLKFATSSMVSTRVRVTLFPVSPASSALPNIGDMPTWIHTVRGSFDTCIEIPYLASEPWKHMYSTDQPVVRVELLTPIPQPFDKVASVYMAAFIAAGPDMAFTGLQSCVPSTLQCLTEDMRNPIRNGPLLRADYQGGISSVYQILGRFSSRAVNPATNIPVPVFIPNQATKNTLDNFDYVSNMFKFFNGECRVKVAFSKGAASGLLRTTIRNSNAAAVGDDFKAGNGLVMSHQAVWPMLDYTFPYQNTVPYNTIRDPLPFYAPYVGDEAEISSFLIAATDTFRLHYLMPVPDFADTVVLQTANVATAQEVAALRRLRRDRLGIANSGEKIEFQSLSPNCRSEINAYVRKIIPALTLSSTTVLTNTLDVFQKEVECEVNFAATNDDPEPIHAAVLFSNSITPPVLVSPGYYGTETIFACAVPGAGQVANARWTFNSYSAAQTIYAHVLKQTTTVGNLDYSLSFSTRKIGKSVTNVNSVDTSHRTELIPGLSAFPVAVPDTIDVLVANSILDVRVDSIVSVQGSLNPQHPVYTSSYPDLV